MVAKKPNTYSRLLGLFAIVVMSSSALHSNAQEIPDNFKTKNLVPWCLVPFDAKKRGPEERAKMLANLGFKKFAYDWRDEHIPTWDEEYKHLKAQGVELTAFWCSSSLKPSEDSRNQKILDFVKRNKVKTQFWMMLPEKQLDEIKDEEARVQTAAEALRNLAKVAEPLGCSVGVYNHGGWIGRPSTLVRVMQSLKDVDNVGIVYNFHHAHHDLSEFPAVLKQLMPYLVCLNLNGMTEGGPKIQTIGEGELDAKILGWIREADYRGPIGILDHRNEMDAEESLQLNLDGLKKMLKESK